MAKIRRPNAWKHAERKVASLIGGVRSPHDGHGGVDVYHPTLAIDVKSRTNLSLVYNRAMEFAEDRGAQIAIWKGYGLIRLSNVRALIQGVSKRCDAVVIAPSQIKYARSELPKFARDVIDGMKPHAQERKLPVAILHNPRTRYSDAIMVAEWKPLELWLENRREGLYFSDDIDQPIRTWRTELCRVLTLTGIMPTGGDIIGRVRAGHWGETLWGSESIYIVAPEKPEHIPGPKCTLAWTSLRHNLQDYRLHHDTIRQVVFEALQWRAFELHNGKMPIDAVHAIKELLTAVFEKHVTA